MKELKELFFKSKMILYTSATCDYCKQVKETLDKSNISYIEKDILKHKEDWQELVTITNMPVTPAIHYMNRFFLPARDFLNPVNMMEVLNTSQEIDARDKIDVIIERSKTFNYQISQAFNSLDKRLKLIDDKQDQILTKGSKKKTKK